MLTLQELKKYLQKHGPTTLLKLAKYFTAEPQQIMCIAEHYIAKGKIDCQRKTISCGTSCHACFTSNLIKLSWINNTL